MLKGKNRAAQTWLPTQVLSGMDVSDPDPANWRPFGTEHEAAQELAKHEASKSSSKSGLPGQSARAEQ